MEPLVTEETMRKWADIFGVTAATPHCAEIQNTETKLDVVDQQCKLAQLESKVLALEAKQKELVVLLMQVSNNKFSPKEIIERLATFLK